MDDAARIVLGIGNLPADLLVRLTTPSGGTFAGLLSTKGDRSLASFAMTIPMSIQCLGEPEDNKSGCIPNMTCYARTSEVDPTPRSRPSAVAIAKCARRSG
jgi:hypothetical protein